MCVLFECDRVSFRRAGMLVLDGLTIRIGEGATCVAGPSGAGKSTLLRLLNRLADPDEGTVRYRGRDVRDYDVLALRREVGLVPQLPALLDGTVAMNVGYGAQLAGRAVDVGRVLELAGLDRGFADRPAGPPTSALILAVLLWLADRVIWLENGRLHDGAGVIAAIHITMAQVAATLALVAVAVAISAWQGAGLERDIASAQPALGDDPADRLDQPTGLILFAGTMVGMLLAGAAPQDAVRLQLILLYVLLGSVAIGALTSVLLAYRNFFTPAQQLRELPA